MGGEGVSGLPEDGIHEVPMEEYLSWPAWSGSVVDQWGQRPPYHVRHRMLQGAGGGETLATRLGTLTHSAVLEPDTLEELYTVEPELDPALYPKADGSLPAPEHVRKTGAFKAKLRELEDQGRTIVRRDHMAEALVMRDCVKAHPAASALIQAEGPVEASILVTDPDTGLRLKARPDKLALTPAGWAHVNVKTAADVGDEALSRALYTYGYFTSFAFYERVLNVALGGVEVLNLMLVLATEGPEDDRVCVRELDLGAMEAGRALVDKRLQDIAACERAGRWPGLPRDVRSITLPHWAWRKVDDELTQTPEMVTGP